MKERTLKQCKHPGCLIKKIILSKGLCNYHRYRQRVDNNEIKIKAKKNKNNRKEVLSEFFTYHLEKIRKNPYCENCGNKLFCNISNIAHILPKRNTANPEIMGEINNALYLCSSFNGDGQGCHDRYDKIQGSSKVYLMNCFPTAVERYLTFKNKVRYNKYVSVFEDWIKEKNEI